MLLLTETECPGPLCQKDRALFRLQVKDVVVGGVKKTVVSVLDLSQNRGRMFV